MNQPNRKIEVFLNADTDDENPYTHCAIVLEWGNGPCMVRDDAGVETIMPGTENGCWHNTGIVCWALSPMSAFSDALKIARDRGY